MVLHNIIIAIGSLPFFPQYREHAYHEFGFRGQCRVGNAAEKHNPSLDELELMVVSIAGISLHQLCGNRAQHGKLQPLRAEVDGVDAVSAHLCRDYCLAHVGRRRRVVGKRRMKDTKSRKRGDGDHHLRVVDIDGCAVVGGTVVNNRDRFLFLVESTQQHRRANAGQGGDACQ